MLKLLIFLALVLAVLYFFSLRNRRPPGDWRRRDDRPGSGPVVPTGSIGLDAGSKKSDASPGERQPAPADAGADAGGDGGGD